MLNHSSLRHLGDIFLLSLVTILLMTTPMVWAKEQPAPKEILILNSFFHAIPWEKMMRQSFRDTMAGSQIVPQKINEEYLDLGSGTAVGHKAVLKKMLRVKYSHRALAMVIAYNDLASDFLLENGQELFPGIPQVISGSGRDAIMHPPRHRRMTSVYFELNMLSTVRFALKLLPATQDVLVVVGSDPTGKYLQKRARKQLAGLGPSVRVTYLTDKSMEEILSQVSRLPPHTLIYYLGIGKDSEGKRFAPHEACRMISKVATAPLIGITDTYMGNGALGGSMASAEEVGRILAKIAMRILAGENPDNIPPQKAPDFVVYDWRQLKRWGLLDHPLIAGAEIRFRQYSFFDLYWHWVLVVAGLLILQTLVILLLLVQRKLKREKELEHQRSERALKESEERYRQMFHSNRVIQLLVDPKDGAIVDANQAACNFYGHDHAEMTAKSVFEINTDDSDKVAGLISDIENCKAISFQAKHRLASNEVRDVEVYSGVLTQQGRTFFHSTIFDITKRKQAEEALRISEEKFSKLFFASPVPITITTAKEGRILEANNAFLKQCGLSRQECLGLTSTELGLWVESSSSRKYMLSLFRQQGYLRNFEMDIWLNNQIRTILWSAETIFYDNQECLLGVYVDITERKQAEEALLRSETQFRNLVDNAPMAVLIQTKENIAYVNNKAMEAFGAQCKEDLLGQPVLDRVPPRFHGLIKERIRLVNQEKQNLQPLEYQFTKLEGTPFDVEVLSVPIHYLGEDGALVFFQDITQRKKQEADKQKLEAQLRQAQRMEAIGTLAGGIAHDFNNILGVVIGFAEMAMGKSQDQQDYTKELEQILKAGERARDLVRQILTYRMPLDLNMELEHTVELLGRTLPKMISIETNLAPDLMPILANANQLEQVMLNLAANAQHAMPEGGRLIIDTQNITLTDEYCARHLELEPGRYVLLQISDTGRGMDEQTSEHIFDPFYTTKAVGEGTGLGLSTVFGIVKSFQGQISCYSELGLGTTFKIYLPAFENEIISSKTNAWAEEELQIGSETILLVDDDAPLRELGKQMLTRAGYRVFTVKSGEEALEVYAEKTNLLDLVILDLGMPGIGGYKALEGILEINPRAKVIIASGYAANGAVKRALMSGAAGYLAKPFNLAELLATVRTMLDEI